MVVIGDGNHPMSSIRISNCLKVAKLNSIVFVYGYRFINVSHTQESMILSYGDTSWLCCKNNTLILMVNLAVVSVYKYVRPTCSKNHPFMVISNCSCLGYPSTITWSNCLSKNKSLIYSLKISLSKHHNQLRAIICHHL